MELCRI